MNDHNTDPIESGARTLCRGLLYELTGSYGNPRRQTAVNVWRKTRREAIELEVKPRAASNGIKRSGLAALRDKVAKELFAKLDKEEQALYQKRVREEHDAAIKAWKEEVESGPSTDPVVRQKCISGLGRFAQPILDLITEATGWKVTLIAGGPLPKKGGGLVVTSFHSSNTMYFGHIERIKSVGVPVYGRFLKKYYPPEECRARALPPAEEAESCNSIDRTNVRVIRESISLSLQPHPTSPHHLLAVAEHQHSPSSRGPSSALSRPPSPIAQQGPSPSVDQATFRLPAAIDLENQFHARDASPQLFPGRLANQKCLPCLSSSQSNASSPLSSVQDSPTPASLLHVSASPGVGERDTTPSSIPTDLSNTRGQKRLGDPGTDASPHPKRSRSTRSASPPIDTVPRTSPSERADASGDPHPTMTLPLHPSPSSRPPLIASADAPSWFSNSLAMFQSNDADLGDSWKHLVSLWAAFEANESYGNLEAGTLKAKHRPQVVRDWIQRARLSSWRPVILNVAAVENSFIKWWTSLQPGWRLEEGGQLDVTKKEGNWEPLRQAGANGLLSVVAALFFWGHAIRRRSASGDKWTLFVDDCITVFQRLLSPS